MSEQPAVSVIIVNFNGGSVLSECVHNVLDSTLPVEVFIVDNASTDTSLNQLRREIGNDTRVTIIENALNLGFATANNVAVDRTHAPWVLFLNPDCLVRRDTLERMREVMVAHPKAGMGGALILNTDGTEQKGCRRRVPTPWRTFVRVMGLSKLLPDHPWFCDFDLSVEPLPEEPVPVDAISGSFMFTRREAIERVGLMDEAYFLHCEDLDWCMRFRQAGYDVLFVSHVPVTHYKGVCGRRRPVRVLWHMHSGMVRFYRKFFQRKYSPVLMWAVMLAVWLRFTVMAAYVFFRRDVVGNLREAMQRRRERLAASLAPPQINVPVRASRRGRGSTVAVTGASGQIGVFLVPRLVNEGYRVFAVTRGNDVRDPMVNVAWIERDLSSSAEQGGWPGISACFHLAPIWLLPANIAALGEAGVRRIVAFSSTSVLTKLDSDSRRERDLVGRIDAAETQCEALCREHDIALTILRPTMIYGCGMDKTVTAIATFIRRFGFFPIAGKGSGLRQPIHAQDLAEACISLLDNQATYGRTYNLSGGETLSYRRMVEDIFQAMGRRVRILSLPLALLRTGLRALRWLPGFGHLTPAMATRMDRDLCFPHAEASRDFGFTPRRFLATPATRAVQVSDPDAPAPGSERLVLVTGATGFIGSALCEALVSRGRPVRGLARNEELAGALPAGVEARIVGDIVQPVDWAPVVQGVDCIVHLAGFVHETPSEPLAQARVRYAGLNVEATRRLAQAAAAAGVRRLVYISSVKVHGEKTGPNERLNEGWAPAPVGPYAETKLAAERVLREIEETTGLDVVVVRPPLVYGPGVKANFLRLVRSVDGGMPLPLAAVRNQRSFIYLGNLVDVLVRCLDSPRALGETFLVSDGEDVSTPKLIRNIAFCLGKEPNLVQVPVGVLSISGGISGGAALINRLIDSLVIDNSRVTEVLGWRPPYTMLEGLQATVDWYLQAVAPLRSPRGYAAGAEFGVRAVGMQAG